MATGNIFPIKQQNVGTGGRFVIIFFVISRACSLMSFQIYRRRMNKVPGYVAAFWAMRPIQYLFVTDYR